MPFISFIPDSVALLSETCTVCRTPFFVCTDFASINSHTFRAAGWGQVDSKGAVLLCGEKSSNVSNMTLSGGAGLGPKGAQRLADLLCVAPPPPLDSLNLRLPFYSLTRARARAHAHTYSHTHCPHASSSKISCIKVLN